MSTLSSALERVDLIFGIYIALILAYGLLARHGRRTGSMAIATINHGGLIGLAVIVALPFISPFPVNLAQILTGAFIEIFCALVFLVFCWRIIHFLRTNAKPVPDRYLMLLLGLKLAFFIANYTASGGQYGIFSDDSRIDFLMISPVLARTFYLDMIIDFIVLLSSCLRYQKLGRFRLLDALAILGLICITFLSGSKGASFLLIAYAMLLAYAAFPTFIKLIPAWTVIAGVCLGSALLFGYIYVLSAILEVPIVDQVRLTLSRFLLSADARIMAFDPNVNSYVLSQPHGAFLSELFRGPARLLGFATAEFPIGVYQYQYQVDTTNYVGSTNQLSAMFVIYGGAFWLLEFAIIAAIVAFSAQFFFRTLRSSNSAVSWVSAAALFWLGDTLCKGFDAFVQLLPISVLVVVALMFVSRFRLLPRTRSNTPLSHSDNDCAGAS